MSQQPNASASGEAAASLWAAMSAASLDSPPEADAASIASDEPPVLRAVDGAVLRADNPKTMDNWRPKFMQRVASQRRPRRRSTRRAPCREPRRPKCGENGLGRRHRGGQDCRPAANERLDPGRVHPEAGGVEGVDAAAEPTEAGAGRHDLRLGRHAAVHDAPRGGAAPVRRYLCTQAPACAAKKVVHQSSCRRGNPSIITNVSPKAGGTGPHHNREPGDILPTLTSPSPYPPNRT